MLLVFVAATKSEIAPFQSYLKDNYAMKNEFQFTKAGLDIHLLITGIGMTMTAYALTKYIIQIHPDYVINLGIAGGFPASNLKIGAVVQVRKAIFGDLGIETAEGDFKTIFENNLADLNQFPFQKGILHNTHAPTFLNNVTALSVNKVHGQEAAIKKIITKFNPDIETMESGAIFYTCLSENVPFMEIRSISNFVEKRDKSKWNIPLALNNLTNSTIELLELMEALHEENKRQPAGFRLDK